MRWRAAYKPPFCGAAVAVRVALRRGDAGAVVEGGDLRNLGEQGHATDADVAAIGRDDAGGLQVGPFRQGDDDRLITHGSLDGEGGDQGRLRARARVAAPRPLVATLASTFSPRVQGRRRHWDPPGQPSAGRALAGSMAIWPMAALATATCCSLIFSLRRPLLSTNVTAATPFSSADVRGASA